MVQGATGAAASAHQLAKTGVPAQQQPGQPAIDLDAVATLIQADICGLFPRGSLRELHGGAGKPGAGRCTALDLPGDSSQNCWEGLSPPGERPLVAVLEKKRRPLKHSSGANDHVAADFAGVVTRGFGQQEKAIADLLFGDDGISQC